MLVYLYRALNIDVLFQPIMLADVHVHIVHDLNTYMTYMAYYILLITKRMHLYLQ